MSAELEERVQALEEKNAVLNRHLHSIISLLVMSDLAATQIAIKLAASDLEAAEKWINNLQERGDKAMEAVREIVDHE